MEPAYAYLEIPLPPPTQEQKDEPKQDRGIAVLDLGGKDEDSGSGWVSQ